MIWALLFLRFYGSEDTQVGILCTSRKKIRKYAWMIVKIFSDIDVVRLFNFYNN